MKPDYKSSIQSDEAIEWLDKYLFRPIAYYFALFFRKIGFVPNAVTILSGLVGITGCVMLYPDNPGLNLAGGLLFLLSYFLDCTDGQLARMTGKCSESGRFLDGFTDDFRFLALYLFIILKFYPIYGAKILILGILTMVSQLLQAGAADCYKNVHIYFRYGRNASELISSEKLRCQTKDARRNKSYFKAAYLSLYTVYTLLQERLCPSLHKLISFLDEKYPEGLDANLSDSLSRKSIRIYRMVNVITEGAYTLYILISILLDVPWLFMVIGTTFGNLMLAIMVLRHESMCRKVLYEESIRYRTY